MEFELMPPAFKVTPPAFSPQKEEVTQVPKNSFSCQKKIVVESDPKKSFRGKIFAFLSFFCFKTKMTLMLKFQPLSLLVSSKFQFRTAAESS